MTVVSPLWAGSVAAKQRLLSTARLLSGQDAERLGLQGMVLHIPSMAFKELMPSFLLPLRHWKNGPSCAHKGSQTALACQATIFLACARAMQHASSNPQSSCLSKVSVPNCPATCDLRGTRVCSWQVFVSITCCVILKIVPSRHLLQGSLESRKQLPPRLKSLWGPGSWEMGKDSDPPQNFSFSYFKWCVCVCS